MAYKPVKIVALENEAERLEKMAAKITARLETINAELAPLYEKEAEKKSGKAKTE